MNGMIRACFLILVLVMAACQRAPDSRAFASAPSLFRATTPGTAIGFAR